MSSYTCSPGWQAAQSAGRPLSRALAGRRGALGAACGHLVRADPPLGHRGEQLVALPVSPLQRGDQQRAVLDGLLQGPAAGRERDLQRVPAALASLADALMPEAYEDGGPAVALSTAAGFVLSYVLSLA